MDLIKVLAQLRQNYEQLTMAIQYLERYQSLQEGRVKLPNPKGPNKQDGTVKRRDVAAVKSRGAGQI
ncbi:MAG TPA: hypothetical protein VML19_03280 [Verrucomicrobiae bacterium]|nr:hypothetical protein [Verrucomicrobiae bacterium]